MYACLPEEAAIGTVAYAGAITGAQGSNCAITPFSSLHILVPLPTLLDSACVCTTKVVLTTPYGVPNCTPYHHETKMSLFRLTT